MRAKPLTKASSSPGSHDCHDVGLSLYQNSSTSGQQFGRETVTLSQSQKNQHFLKFRFKKCYIISGLPIPTYGPHFRPASIYYFNCHGVRTPYVNILPAVIPTICDVIYYSILSQFRLFTQQWMLMLLNML